LRHEYETTYETFFDAWEDKLYENDKRLLKFMVNDRNLEIHESGSNRIEGEARVPIYGSYKDALGTVLSSILPGTEPAAIIKPVYSFTIDGRDVPAVDACSSYFSLLRNLVTDFKLSVGNT
jgi:hypothetical protein